MAGTERMFCDLPIVLKEATSPVVCDPRMKKGYKDKGKCADCSKAGFALRPSNPEASYYVKPTRLRDYRY